MSPMGDSLLNGDRTMIARDHSRNRNRPRAAATAKGEREKHSFQSRAREEAVPFPAIYRSLTKLSKYLVMGAQSGPTWACELGCEMGA